MTKIFISCDQHIPLHDKKTLKLTEDFIKDEKPDVIIFNGDFLDGYDASSFPKDPRNKKRLVDEIKIGKKYLEHINTISKARKILIWGNHENRVNKFLLKKAPEMIDFVCLKILLQTDGWEMIAESDVENYIKINKIFVGHFNRVNKHSAMTAKNLVLDKGVSIIQAHTHRLGSFYIRTLNGTLRGFEGGCMCKLNPSYMNFPNWQQGFIFIENKNVYQIEIIKHSFTWHGKVYK